MLDLFTQPVFAIDNSHPFGCTNNLWSNVFDQIEYQRRLDGQRQRRFELEKYYHQLAQQEQAERQRRLDAERKRNQGQVFVKQVETNNVHQIQLYKNAGDFGSYEIRLIQNRNSGYVLKIISEAEEFLKAFELEPKRIDVEHIDWKYHPELNVLTINLPIKNQTAEHKKKQIKAKSIEKAYKKNRKHEKTKLKALKKKEKKLRKLEEDRKEQEKEQVTDSKTQTPISKLFTSVSDSSETSEYETPSESDSDNDNVPKVKHSPTMEEVEDEEFVLLRKRFQ